MPDSEDESRLPPQILSGGDIVEISYGELEDDDLPPRGLGEIHDEGKHKIYPPDPHPSSGSGEGEGQPIRHPGNEHTP